MFATAIITLLFYKYYILYVVVVVYLLHFLLLNVFRDLRLFFNVICLSNPVKKRIENVANVPMI